MDQTTVKNIIKKSRHLWKIANDINPAMRPAGSGLDWKEYEEAVQKAKDFENRGVIIDED